VDGADVDVFGGAGGEVMLALVGPAAGAGFVAGGEVPVAWWDILDGETAVVVGACAVKIDERSFAIELLRRTEIDILAGDGLAIAQEAAGDSRPGLQCQCGVRWQIGGGDATPAIRTDGDDVAFTEFGLEAKTSLFIRACLGTGTKAMAREFTGRAHSRLLVGTNVNHLRVGGGFAVGRENHAAWASTLLELEVPSGGARFEGIGMRR
jgi:hypothetical protein